MSYMGGSREEQGPLENHKWLNTGIVQIIISYRDRTGNAPGMTGHRRAFSECLEWLRVKQINERVFIIIFLSLFKKYFKHSFRIIFICLKLHLFNFRGLKLDH